jgi:hypothetical protein
MQDELARFVDSLAIPADRKQVVLAELADHVASAVEAAVRSGADRDAAARTALGDLEALRPSFEAIEPAFATTRWRALGRGVVAGALVAAVIDQGGALMAGAAGALVAVAIAVVLSPPRTLQLLRAELRARRVPGAFGLGRGVPIGPASTYLFTVLSLPFLVWIGLIVGRTLAGPVDPFDTPWSAFAVATVTWAVLLVESVRARRAIVS